MIPTRHAQRGTTSAHAENTPKIFCIRSRFWNYLRARGEYPTKQRRQTQRKELPPRTRRIRLAPVIPVDSLGTTSAHAENTHP